MATFFVGMALFLFLNLLAGLIRVVRGPEPPDRMLAAQLLGTTGVGILLLLGEGMGEPALRDVALLFALLAILTVFAFVERPAESEGEEAEEGETA